MIERGAFINQAQEEGQRKGSGYRLHPTLPAQLSEETSCRYGHRKEKSVYSYVTFEDSSRLLSFFIIYILPFASLFSL